MTGLFAAWRGMWRCVHPVSPHGLVVYSEGGGYEPYFRDLFDALKGKLALTYVSSRQDDPLLAEMGGHYVGTGAARTAFFSTVRADLLLMTMPDLDSFHIKRSRRVGCYAYVHHSLVSTHMAYRPAAFDAFDVIFCAGPHHNRETRTREAALGLLPKILVDHGYGPVDVLRRTRLHDAPHSPPTILLAPSWGDGGLLDEHGARLCRIVLDAGLHLVVRPHPRTCSHSPQVVRDLERQFGGHPGFRLDVQAGGRESYVRADAMISDWSGAAFEFAIGMGRPVLFVDGRRKVNNPDYASLGCVPFEDQARSLVGRVVAPDDLDQVPGLLHEMLAKRDEWRQAIGAVSPSMVHHLGQSGAVAARAILDLLEDESRLSPLDWGGLEQDLALVQGGTARFVRDCVAAKGRLEEHQIQGLIALTRKVDIARKVWADYDTGWQKRSDSLPLAPLAWPGLVASFLAAAAQRGTATPDGAKLLNAGLNGLDLYEGRAYRQALRRWAEELVQAVAFQDLTQ